MGASHRGPNAFDIDKNGNIYILDSVHNCIKIYDHNVDQLQSFPLANDSGMEYGYIALDENNNIWHLNMLGNFIRTYSSDGTLLQSIQYGGNTLPGLGFDLTVRDGEIFGPGEEFEITGLSSKSGIKGEPVFKAVLKKSEKNKLNCGIVSKRFYKYVPHSILDGNILPTTPRISITEENGTTHELLFYRFGSLIFSFFQG